jgi:hypothetical protein
VNLLVPGAFVGGAQHRRVADQADAAELQGAVDNVIVQAHDGAALGRGEVLGGEEGERGDVGQRPDRLTVQRPADGVRGVLEQQRVASVSDLGQALDVDRVSGIVDPGDDLGAVGHGG